MRGVLLVVIAAVTLNAQTLNGTIAGKVVDAQGSVLPGATITATRGSERRTAITNVRGEYGFEQLPPGRYQLTVEMSGFVGDVFDLEVEAGHASEKTAKLRVREPPRVVDLLVELRRFTRPYVGAEPLDCGQNPPPARRAEPVSANRLEEAVTCGREAAARKRPFWALKQSWGIDSFLVQGLLGTADGVVYRFSYDSAPCGEPGRCAGRFSAELCPKPTVAPDRGLGASFSCAR